jgi:hypothetical protein
MHKKIYLIVILVFILAVATSQAFAAPPGRVVLPASLFFEGKLNPCVPENLTNVSGSIQMITKPTGNGFLIHVNAVSPITAVGSVTGDDYLFFGTFKNLVIEPGQTYIHNGMMIKPGSGISYSYHWVLQVNNTAEGPEVVVSRFETTCH